MALLSQMLMGAPTTSPDDEWRKAALAELLGMGDPFKRNTDVGQLVAAGMPAAAAPAEAPAPATPAPEVPRLGGRYIPPTPDGSVPPGIDLSRSAPSPGGAGPLSAMDGMMPAYLDAARVARGGAAPSPSAPMPMAPPWKPSPAPASTIVSDRPAVGTDYAPPVETPRDITERKAASALPAPAEVPKGREPNIWDRMGALARGYNTGGLVGGVADAMNIDRSFEDQNATVRALAAKIGDPDLARMISRDPDLMKTVIGNVFAPKAGNWQKIEYTDDQGRPSVGLFNQSSPTSGIIRVGGGKAADLPADLVTKVGQLRTSIAALKRARPVFDREFGASDVAQLAAASSPGGDIAAVSGEIGRARRDMMQSAEGAIRIASGAAVPETEMSRYIQMYIPTVTDTVASRKQKMDNLGTFLDELATAVNTKSRVLTKEEVAEIHDRHAARASGAAPPAAGGVVRVGSPEEARRLPKGTKFVGHDGVEREVM